MREKNEVTELLNSKKILKSIPEGYEVFNEETGKKLKIGDEFTTLRAERRQRERESERSEKTDSIPRT
jgi:hypothetical protein